MELHQVLIRKLVWNKNQQIASQEPAWAWTVFKKAEEGKGKALLCCFKCCSSVVFVLFLCCFYLCFKYCFKCFSRCCFWCCFQCNFKHCFKCYFKCCSNCGVLKFSLKFFLISTCIFSWNNYSVKLDIFFSIWLEYILNSVIEYCREYLLRYTDVLFVFNFSVCMTITLQIMVIEKVNGPVLWSLPIWNITFKIMY